MRVVVAMSGGVDSSVAAALLVEEGHHVTGVFLRNGVAEGPKAASGRQGCCSVGDSADAARVADLLGVPFYSLDFSADFDRIVEDFARSYAQGRTPNPCVQCNRDLKFGRLMGFADALGADAVATGHYAALETRDGRVALRMPADRAKDQTYVLFPLSQEQLRRTMFPLASWSKSQTRELAAARGLPVADKPESMEICFVPGGDYREVARTRAPQAFVGGDIVAEETGAVLGRHAGVGSVTVGQRRGMGALGAAARYVTRIDAARNLVVVGDERSVLRREVVVEQWNPVASPMPAEGSRIRGLGKIRRAHTPQVCELRADVAQADGRPTNGTLRVVFDEPVRAPAPGQALVVYDAGGCVLGGGWIAAAGT